MTGAPRETGWSSVPAVDEPHYLVEPWPVAIGGIDLHPGRLHRHPVEGGAMPCELRQVMTGPGVSVRPAHQAVLAAPQDPLEGHIVGDHAVDDPQMRKTAERLKAWPPDVILERSVSNGRDASAQQQLQHAEEDRQRPHRQLIAWRPHEPGTGMSHAFLDLIPADRRAPHSPREPMGQRGLARAYRAADNHEGRHRCHLTVIATITQAGSAPYRADRGEDRYVRRSGCRGAWTVRRRDGGRRCCAVGSDRAPGRGW